MSAVLPLDLSLQHAVQAHYKKCCGYSVDDFVDAINNQRQLNVTCLHLDPPFTYSAELISTGELMRCYQFPATTEHVAGLLESESVVDIEIV